MVGCTRSSLNVVASEKGVVVGRMKFRDDGDLIDCTKMGVGGKVIPSLIDRVSDISVRVCSPYGSAGRFVRACNVARVCLLKAANVLWGMRSDPWESYLERR